MSDHIVHVGLQKTGSTWLQRHVFSTVEGAVPTSDNGVIYELMRSLTHDDVFMVETFRTALDELGPRVLMSWESLAGAPWGPSNLSGNVDRLARVAPDARIVIVGRDPDQLSRSLYAQYINRGGYHDIGTFQRNVLRSAYLDVDAAAAEFRRRFDQVLVLDHADLRKDPEATIADLERFADVRFPRPLDTTPANPSLTGWRLQILRAINRWFRVSEHNPAPRWPIQGAGGMRNVLQRGQVRPVVHGGGSVVGQPGTSLPKRQ